MYYFNIFFLYSIFGYIIESIIYSFYNKESSILYGFWTPIYGISAVLIIYIYNKFIIKSKINNVLKAIFVFLIGFILISILEYIGGNLIELIFHKVFWNYYNFKFSIGKYNSLEVSVIWGVFSLIIIYLLKKISDKITKIIPKFVTWILIFLFLIDVVFTLIFNTN